MPQPTMQLDLGDDAVARRARMIKTIERELGYRRRVYPRRVADGKMTQRLADEQLAAMDEVLQFLQAEA